MRICAKHGLHALTATFRAIAMSTTTRPSPMVSLGVLRSPDASHSFNLEGRGFVYDLATRGTNRGSEGFCLLLSAGFLLLFQGKPILPSSGTGYPRASTGGSDTRSGRVRIEVDWDRIRGDSGRFRRVIRRVGDGASAIILVVGGQLCTAKGRDERHPEDDGGLPDQVLDRVGPKPRRMRE